MCCLINDCSNCNYNTHTLFKINQRGSSAISNATRGNVSLNNVRVSMDDGNTEILMVTNATIGYDPYYAPLAAVNLDEPEDPLLVSAASQYSLDIEVSTIQ